MASNKESNSVADIKESSKGINDPYLDARREWNERYGSYISRAKNWRLMAFGVLGVCLVQTVGLVVMATQNKLVPYVVQVDKLGSAVPVARADQMGKTDERVVKALLARFISDARGVVSDGIAQRQMIDRTYAMLSNGTRALSIVNEFYKGDPPYSRAATSGVTTEISSVIPVTEKTWQVEWEETTRSTSGAIINKLRWKANLTLAFNPPTNERQIRVNPIGLFITDLSWSQVL
jgi:type IV secretory pathway TrbF-like protein